MSLEDDLRFYIALATRRGYKPGTPEYFQFIRTQREHDKDGTDGR